jgi:hypothetical protein
MTLDRELDKIHKENMLLETKDREKTCLYGLSPDLAILLGGESSFYCCFSRIGEYKPAEI